MPMIDRARHSMLAPLLALSLVIACSNDGMTSAPAPGPPPSSGPPHSPTTVEVRFCNGVAPDWVAFQDGDAAWARATPVVDGAITRFRYAFTSERGAVAAVRVFPPGNRGTTLNIQYGRPNELITTGDTTPIHCGPTATNALLGTVEGIGASDVVAVTAGFGAQRSACTEPAKLLASRPRRRTAGYSREKDLRLGRREPARQNHTAPDAGAARRRAALDTRFQFCGSIRSGVDERDARGPAARGRDSNDQPQDTLHREHSWVVRRTDSRTPAYNRRAPG